MFNTLDLDFCGKDQAEIIVAKIRTLRCCEHVEMKSSSLKGYHVLLWCKLACDRCRFVYDDPNRFIHDESRPEHMRNVLFDDKIPFQVKAEFRRQEKKRQKSIGEWHV